MHVILIGEPLEDVDCFKYLGSQVAADLRMRKGCATQNRAWGALKRVLSNRGLGSVYTKE